MRVVKVLSSNISTLTYYEDTQVLEIEYVKDATYKFSSVPLKVFDAFVKSDSKGKFFHSEIKGTYAFEKL